MTENNSGSNDVLLNLGVNGIDEVKAAKKEIDGLNDSLDKTGDADVGTEKIKSFKQQLKEAKEEALRLQQAGKENTQEYKNAVAAISELVDSQDVLNRSIQIFDPGNKFAAISKFASTGAQAIGGLVGGVELLGLSSSTAEEAIKKMMAIQQVVGMIDAIGDLQDFYKAYILRLAQGTAAKNAETAAIAASTVATEGQVVATEASTVATNGLGLAFKTLGIGLIVAGIGLLVTHFDTVKEVVYKFIPGLKSLGEFFTKITQSVTDFVGITSQATRELDKLTAATNRNNTAIDNGIKLLEAQGGRESQIYELKKKRINGELNLLREKLKVEKILSEEEQKQFRDLKFNLQVLDAAERKRLADKAKTDAEEAKRRAEEARKKREEAEFNSRKDLTKVGGVEVKDAEGNLVSQPSLIDTELSLETAIRNKWDTIQTENEAVQRAERIRIAEEEFEAKQKLLYGIADVTSVVSDLIGRDTIAGRSIAAASALISTYAAISGQLKAFAGVPIPGYAIAQAVATGLVGFAQVKNILAVKVPGASGGGSIGSTPSVSAPVINSTLLQRNANGSDDIVNAVSSKNEAPIRAYIVDKDLNKQRSKEDFYKSQSEI